MISCNTYQNTIHRYAEDINQSKHERLSLVRLVFMIYRLIAMTVYHLIFTAGVVKDIRHEMSECAKTCINGACLRRVYGKVAKIRDDYQSIQEAFAKTYGLRLFDAYMIDIVSMWGNLAEDLLIASDLEITSALNRMAENASDLRPSLDWRKELHAM